MIFYLYVKTHNKTKLKYLGRTMEVRIRAGKKSAKIITGYKWITNGIISTKVPPTQKLPDGFRYGRMYSRKSSF